MRSIRSIAVGLFVLVLSSALLFWNEGRALREARALAEGAELVKTIDPAKVDPANDGKLVHLVGRTTAARPVRDEDLDFEVAGLRLQRKVEMFQWKEAGSNRRSGGSSEADFTYTRTWSEKPIDWTKFRFPQDHRNPPLPSIASRDNVADDAWLGAFRIGERVVALLGAGIPFDVPSAAVEQAVKRFSRPAQAVQDGIFVGDDPAAPHIGDVRLGYSLLPHQTVSVTGRQTGNAITAFRTSNGNDILLASTGAEDAGEAFESAESANNGLSWVLRLIGAALIFLGWRLILHPLRMIASYVPLVDSIAGFSAGVIALVATLVTTPVVIGFAWLSHRPLTALPFIAIGLGLGWGVFAYLRRAASPASAAGPPAGPSHGP